MGIGSRHPHGERVSLPSPGNDKPRNRPKIAPAVFSVISPPKIGRYFEAAKKREKREAAEMLDR